LESPDVWLFKISLKGWKVKFLSQAGKEVLLKAVVQAIPTYSIGVFQLSVALCKELNKLMHNFWWTHMTNRSQIHWMSLEKMGRSKSIGGLGFRDLTFFNKALLAKQGWRLLQDLNSMVAKILQAKYFPNSTFLQANLGSKPSYVWRSLFNSRELLVQGMIWRVGDGKSIQVWGDRWLPNQTSYAVQSIQNIISPNAKVADLIDGELKGWNLSLIKEIFDEDEAKAICQIPLSPGLPKDRLICMGTKNGDFTVRSAYHLSKELKEREGEQCSSGEKGEEIWKVLWAMEVPNTVKLFCWRACNNLLPTKTNLFFKKVVDNMKCPCCEADDETIIHALWECP
jgi:hypothetical protein